MDFTTEIEMNALLMQTNDILKTDYNQTKSEHNFRVESIGKPIFKEFVNVIPGSGGPPPETAAKAASRPDMWRLRMRRAPLPLPPPPPE